MITSASDLISEFKNKQPDSYYFSEDTMAFFGDWLGNYSLSKNTKMVGGVECYKLRRKKPVKCGMQSPAYFAVGDLEHTRGEEDE